MKVGFICPDGVKILTEECLSSCRMGRRCAPRSYLREAAHQRPKDRKPSVTELIKGTREAFLLRTHDYYEAPEDSAFNIIGTRAHSAIEHPIDLEWEGITGIIDDYDEEERTLTSYKVFGSYKVAKVLGLEGHDTGQKGRNGKPIKEFRPTKERDIEEIALQENMYQFMMSFLNKPVYEKRLLMIPRDGDTYVAKGRGVDGKLYYEDIPDIEHEELITYFISKRDALLEALGKNVMPPLCSPSECWEGNKCNGYCPVAKHCTDNPYKK